LGAAEGLQPVEDPSNDDLSFRRNRVRAQLLPLLDEIAERDVASVISRQTELLRDDVELLDLLSAELDPTDAKALALAPSSLARRAVRRLLAFDHPPDSAAVERVLAVARGEAIATDVGGGRRVRRSQGRLALEPASPRRR
jgi:tRNA(Ile)-lysidine synthase